MWRRIRDHLIFGLWCCIMLILLSLFLTVHVYADETGETDEWLKDWDYYVYNSNASNATICLKGYKGDSPEVHVYGRALVDGVSYKIMVKSTERMQNGDRYYVSSFNQPENTAIEEIYFHAVDGQPVIFNNGSLADGLFWGMEDLRSIHFGDGVDFSSVYDGRWMFHGCSSLEEVDIENLDMKRLTKAEGMFEGDEALRSMEIYFPKGCNLERLFWNCSSLERASVSIGSDYSKWVKCKEMFSGCVKLEDVTLNGFSDVGSEEPYAGMFLQCARLASFDISQVNLSKTTDCTAMFAGCKRLRSLDMTKTEWNPDGVDLESFIEFCPGLTEITVDERIIVSNKTRDFAGVQEPAKLKVVGKTSESFDRYIMDKLKEDNRYMEAFDVKAGIVLTGNEAYDGLSYGLSFSDDDGVRVLDNDGSDEICFNGEENGLFVYAPGEYEFSLVQGVRETDPDTGQETVVPLEETEDGFSCRKCILKKRIRVSRNDDGSVDVEEM